MNPRAAIFDLDGTLADSGDLHAESWRRLASETAVATVVDERWFKRTFGRANRDILPELFGRDLAEVELARYSDRKEALYRDLAGTQLRLFPGARELLEALRAAGWRLGIGSSTPRLNLDFTLPLLDLEELIEATVGMEDVPRHKPEPDTFLAVARHLAVPPAGCLVFEDAPAGIEAATRAGMKGIAVTTHHPPDSFVAATAVLDGLWDVRPGDCERWLETVSAAERRGQKL